MSSTAQTLSTVDPAIFTVVGALVGWLIGCIKGFKSSADWISSYDLDAHRLIPLFLDSIIYVIVGPIIGIVIHNPASPISGLVAGITWPVMLGGLTAEKSK